ncbi:MAG: hypothetical protein M3P11_08460 [Actinomycetota bacterium]|nr:hypothetical protein [Actinomycetota bacterium]
MHDFAYPCERLRFGRALRWGAALSGGFLLLGLLGGCTGGAEAPVSGAVVNITLHDFRIDSSTSVSGDGNVVFEIHNQAPVTHEFVVVRSDLPPDQLAIGSDGLSVDEDQLDPVGEIGEVESGTIQTLALHLSPGHYDFFCNLEGHYLGGMHGGLEVSGA